MVRAYRNGKKVIEREVTSMKKKSARKAILVTAITVPTVAVLLTAVVILGLGAYLNKAKAASTSVGAHSPDVSRINAEVNAFMGWDDSGEPIASSYYYEDFNTEEYNNITENGFVSAAQVPLSTFAADVDTGSYCNLRRLIRDGWELENVRSAVRTEEMINYFDYSVDDTGDVFSVQYSVGDCPWNKSNKLLVLTMQANSEINIPNEGNNFVFLIDTSGSMSSEDKLHLAVESFKLLAGTLGPKDKVSIVTYAGSSETLLEGSNDYKKICKVLDQLSADGGTYGSGGIEAAYKCAEKNFVKNGNNRVIIASDGDMNIGITSQSGLVDLIKEKKESGVFLTVLGFGTGNYSDANMESIADAGNGNYFYIDSINEAERVLCEKLMQTTVTVAKDVKFQLEFNPAEVSAYRQIGYENRQMSASDFSDDTKDGGEIGAGAQVTVVYEIIPAGSENDTGSGLKYQDTALSGDAASGELCTVSVRYKDPDSDKSKLIEYPLIDKGISNKKDFDFICAVVEASMVIRNSEYKGTAPYDSAYQLAVSGSGSNKLRDEFCDLLIELGADG